jgi:GNAT superfamily N-acetyltransferase
MLRTSESLQLQWLTAATTVDKATRDQLVSCWRDVSNAGGAVGFPVLPATDEQVAAAVDALVESLDPALNRLLVATVDHVLAGWLVLAGNANILTAHWARVLRVQTAPEHRGTGVGRSLMAEVERAGRDEYRLAALHLELRGGMGLERFYERCGWREIGRWPMALRLGEGDYRDEVLMHLPLGPRP